MKQSYRWGLPLVVLCDLLAGCGFIEDGGKERLKVMDMKGAAERADSMLDATIGFIKPEVQWAHDETTSGSCELTRRRTVMTVISEERRGNFLGLIERFWKDNGYEIVSVNNDKEFPAIFAKTPDGFGIDLTVADKGQAYFEVVTPCVEKSEFAEPATKPNGPSYDGVEIPRPNVHSDFWSATTPIPSPDASPSG